MYIPTARECFTKKYDLLVLVRFPVGIRIIRTPGFSQQEIGHIVLHGINLSMYIFRRAHIRGKKGV